MSLHAQQNLMPQPPEILDQYYARDTPSVIPYQQTSYISCLCKIYAFQFGDHILGTSWWFFVVTLKLLGHPLSAGIVCRLNLRATKFCI
jgi:hypothetical protein